MLWWGSAFAGVVPVQGKLRPQRPLRAAITVLQPETQVERVGIRAVYSVQCCYQTVKFPVGGCGKCHLQFGIRAGGGSQVFQFHIPQGQVYPHTAGGQHLHIGGGFGGGRSSRRNAPQRGESIRQTVILSFEEAAFGCEKEITVERIESCDDCGGTGAAKGTTAETCPNCRGTGVVTQTQRTPLGMFQTQGACPNCRGTGKIIKKPCPKCGGQGRVRKTRKFKVNIPAGIDDGQSIQQRGQGNAGVNGGPAGDLFVTVAIRPHPIFTRNGPDVHVDIPISFAQAALGDTLQVPTIDGRIEYKIPEGTQTGTTFRMRGKGIQNVNGRGRGDQYVRVNIEVPKNLSDKQKKLLREFEETSTDENQIKRKSFWDKVKDALKDK